MNQGFKYKEYTVVPYNHWKYDTAWVAEIYDPELGLIHVGHVSALDPQRACELAMEEYVEVRRTP